MVPSRGHRTQSRQLELHALQAEPTRLRLWVGSLRHTVRAGSLSWLLDGRLVEATTVRPLATVVPGAASGIFELEVGDDGEDHDVEVRGTTLTGDEIWQSLTTRAVPARVPTSPDDELRVLLASCYFEPHDRGLGPLVSTSLRSTRTRPHLTLTMGDQVYLDNPAWDQVPVERNAMAHRLLGKYRRNWERRELLGEAAEGGYSAVLRSAPVAALADDHEFWNNHPNNGLFQVGALRGDDRHQWAEIARDLFDGFQAEDPATSSRFFDIEPLSVLMLDTRTSRAPGGLATMSASDRDVLDTWARHVRDGPRRIPVIVTGASLLQPPKGRWRGRLDMNLADHRDYGAIMATLVTLMREGRSVLALTGDVHYGRITRATIPRPHDGPRPGAMWEIISSPSALVFERPPPLGRTPPSADDFTLDVPLDIGTDPARVAVRANLTCTVKLPRRADGGPGRAQMAEDQVAVLGFRVVPSGVEVLPRYYFVEQHPGRGSLQADAISLYHHTP